MKVKPMTCNATVARAILDERQSQDRRPIKTDFFFTTDPVGGALIVFSGAGPITIDEFIKKHARYQVGDILWMREPGRVVGYDYFPLSVDVEYLADKSLKTVNLPERLQREDGLAGLPAWASETRGIPNGIFKEAARMFRKVTNVRVQRIQDISEADAIAEGIRPFDISNNNGPNFFTYEDGDGVAHNRPTAKEVFAYLWDSIYPDSWDLNDWVWVYEFERTDRPADWPEN